MINYANLKESNFSLEDFTDFFVKNDRLFPNPFSKRVDIASYCQKLFQYGEIFIAYDNEHIVGLACSYMNDFVHLDAFLQALLVDKEYQRLSIGRTLCQEVINEAEKRFMKRIYVTVDADNIKAENLYCSLGYQFDKWKTKSKKIMVYEVQNNRKYYTMSQTQSRLLEMAKEICRIFDEHQIQYFITFGTLLGAVRHAGFIPWDDDFDLFLFDDQYDEAMHVLSHSLSPNCFLEHGETEPLFFHAWAHVKDMHTETDCKLFPQDSIYAHKGLSIDLYRLKRMKKYEVELYRAKENLEYQKRKRRIGLILEEEFKSIQHDILERISIMSGSIDTDDNEDVFGTIISPRFVSFDEVFPLRRYQFEDTQFWGPANYDSILNKLYGDYMQLPPLEKRKPHYSYVKEI